jgi:hypothetical protein
MSYDDEFFHSKLKLNNELLYTGGKFSTGVVDTGDTGGVPCLQIFRKFLKKFEMT